MAELLWDSGHEEQHGKPKQMAVSADTDVYLETVETAQKQNEKTHRTGRGQPLCGNNSLRPQRVLVQCRKQGGQLGTKERLINWGFYDLAAAYQSVHVNYGNRRVPNGTHGGVRGRRLITASYSIKRYSCFKRG